MAEARLVERILLFTDEIVNLINICGAPKSNFMRFVVAVYWKIQGFCQRTVVVGNWQFGDWTNFAV
jgi:hypothetical protein